MSSFFSGTHTFFWHLYFFRHNVWLEKTKYEFLFFWNSIFWSLMFGPKKVWGPFFWNSYFFWNPYFYWHYVWHQKVWIPFFLELFFETHTFFCWNLGTHTFFDVMFGPKKYESCPFPELLVFFFCCDFLMNKIFGFLRDAFFSGTLDSKYLCCWIVFVFADKGLHFIGFLSLGDFKFPWARACVVSLVHAFWLSGSDFLKD